MPVYLAGINYIFSLRLNLFNWLTQDKTFEECGREEAAGMNGIVPKSYFSGPNRKLDHGNRKGERTSERGFEGQYSGTLRPIKWEAPKAGKNGR